MAIPKGGVNMENSIFRQKSIDRISSPEKIDEYTKISGISMWVILACIVLFLAAAVFWGFTGRIEDTVTNEAGQSETVEIAPASLLLNQ